MFSSDDNLRGFALTVLRIATGFVFVMHGHQKLFVFGVAGVQGAFTKIGAPMPLISGPLIGGLEFFGGLALIIGLFTRLVALGLVFDMLGAMVLVHFAKGFFLPLGYEFVFMLCAVALTLLIGGGGSFSLDKVIAKRTAPEPAGRY
jgi:putative oxidoreductase